MYRIYLIGEKERDNSPKGVFLVEGLGKKEIQSFKILS